MLAVILFGVAAGLDNLQVGSSLGLLPMQKSRLHLLAIGFAICEIGGALLGWMFGHVLIEFIGPVAPGVAPVIMLVCGLVVLMLAYRHDAENLPKFVNHKVLLLGLPVALSLDNVIAGAGISFSGLPVMTSALLIGVISAGMSCCGLYFAHWMRQFLPKRIEMLAGIYLCFLAVRMMYADVG
ncbi:manganese efflux pump MntP family protein [Undibacterium sp. TJN19]|uniref:manganese efflux pump MntP n=1 Tax=Undibacterium sp. TJN19 TaxID=3413055 RepID=UPI003BF421C6